MSLILSANSVFAISAVYTSTETKLIETAEHTFQSRLDQAMISIVEQLEAQDALDRADIYEAILTPMIKHQTYAEYGISSLEADDRFYAPNGGTVSYLQPRYTGMVPVPIIVTCLTPSQSAATISGLSTGAENPFFILSSILLTTLGYVPKFSSLGLGANALGLALGVVSYMNYQQLRNIKACDNYVMIIKTYSFVDGSWDTGILGWATHPYIYMPDGMTTADAEFIPGVA